MLNLKFSTTLSKYHRAIKRLKEIMKEETTAFQITIYRSNKQYNCTIFFVFINRYILDFFCNLNCLKHLSIIVKTKSENTHYYNTEIN